MLLYKGEAPVLVFFAPLSFFQKKAGSFYMRPKAAPFSFLTSFYFFQRAKPAAPSSLSFFLYI
jgi:hypothetical protein